MTTTLTRADAAAALARRITERDRIQANLLDLDSSFGKRLLAGAKLAGFTKMQWESTAADLESIWDIFSAYASVVQLASEIWAGTHRPNGPMLTEMTNLLTGSSVVLAGQHVPLARRRLTGSDRPEEHLTLEAAVQRMTTAFDRVTVVVSAAESIWHEVSDRLEQIAAALGPAVKQADSLADQALLAKISTADAELRRMRELLNSDPLALWQDGKGAFGPLDRLLERARSIATLGAELTRLTEDAARRIADVATCVSTAQERERDARKAYDEAAQKISARKLPPMPPTTASLTKRLTDLDALRAPGRLPQLAAELAAIEKESAAAVTGWEEVRESSRALLDRRNELRGLLGAYQAKAGALGAAERPELTRRYQFARALLWSAPCDLAASAEAVRAYQQAVLTVQKETS